MAKAPKKEEKAVFEEWTIQSFQWVKGKTEPNPRKFRYPKDKPTDDGLSIWVEKAVSFGNVEYMELSFYGSAFAEAERLNLQPDELVDFAGCAYTTKGRKLDFRKMDINRPKHIRRTPALREAKASEL